MLETTPKHPRSIQKIIEKLWKKYRNNGTIIEESQNNHEKHEANMKTNEKDNGQIMKNQLKIIEKTWMPYR